MHFRRRLALGIERLEGRQLLAGVVEECRLADVDDDNVVNAADLALVAANYGAATQPYSAGDADGNARVDLNDAIRIQALFGESCFAGPITFAAFGDFGLDGDDEAAVASLVKSSNVDFILTLGDNNYPVGGADTIDANVGKHYREFIGNYSGAYGPGATTNRFFPTLGNHDWWLPGLESIAPYVDYFDLPGDGFANSSGNERYYDFVWGDVHFFALNSSLREPDGRDDESVQAQWLRNRLAESTAAWQIVYFHESPYSSGSDSGSTPDMQWPFGPWGADLVLSAHDHNYERLRVADVTYLVAGTGGAALRVVNPPVPGSIVTYNAAHGALLITADTRSLRAEFRSIADGETLVDCVAFGATECPASDAVLRKIAVAEAIVAEFGRREVEVVARPRTSRPSQPADLSRRGEASESSRSDLQAGLGRRAGDSAAELRARAVRRVNRVSDHEPLDDLASISD